MEPMTHNSETGGNFQYVSCGKNVFFSQSGVSRTNTRKATKMATDIAPFFF